MLFPPIFTYEKILPTENKKERFRKMTSENVPLEEKLFSISLLSAVLISSQKLLLPYLHNPVFPK